MTNYVYQRELSLQAAVLPSPSEASTPFTTPLRPDCALLDILHRRHDGFITFHRKVDDQFEDLCSIPANALPGMFDQLVPLAVEDSYFSVNGMHRTKYGGNRYGLVDDAGEPLKLPQRSRDSARWLTCAYADLDCHTLGIDIGTAVGSIINAQDAGLIPPASVLTRSGRGVWAFWLVDGRDYRDYKVAKEHAAAYGNCIDKWAAIQGALNYRLAKLAADPAAVDVARVCRIPGSINTKAKMRVGYWVQFDDEGHIPTYSLAELAELLSIERPRQRSREVGQAVSALTIRASKGQAGRWLKAKRQFDRLVSLRHTFKEGTRNNAALVYAIILRSLPGGKNLPESELLSEMVELYAHMDQKPTPFTRNDLDGARKSSTRLSKLTNQKIADLLDITPEESQMLDSWPPASRFGPVIDQVGELSREETQRRRREIIKLHLEAKGGTVPSLDTLAEVVARSGLDRPAIATVRTDLKALGIDNPRRHRKLNPKNGNLFVT